MYWEIGKTIKMLAVALAIAFSIFCLGFGLSVAIEAKNGIILGFGICTMIFGPILSWLCTLTLYGFGELIDQVTELLDVIKRRL